MTRNHLGMIGFMLLAAIWLPSCSSIEDESEPDILQRFNAEGKAWLSLQIPTGRETTRTATFSATDDEADILDTYIFLFKGETEGDATFASAYCAKSWQELTPQDEQVARQFTILVSNVNLQPKDKLWAYVLMNNNGGAITTPEITADAGVTSVEFADKTIGSETTFSKFLEATTSTLTKEVGDKTYYLMTSAPMSDKPGGSNNPTGAKISTLVQIPATSFFPTEEEAFANPAATINVERTAAKIIAKKYAGEMRIADNQNLQILDIKVALDHYNTKSYVSRHDAGEGIGLKADKAKDENQYRFVEHRAIDGNRYRTYWCKDANYEGDEGGSGLKPYKDDEDDAFKSIKDGDQTFLTHENTFDVAHQSLDCSTQLIVRVKLSNSPFYYIETTGEQIVSDPSPATQEEGTSASSSFARTRAGEEPTLLINYLREWVMKEIPAAKAWVETYAGGSSSFITITAHEPDASGKVGASVSQSAYTSKNSDGYKKFQYDKGSIETGSITIGGKTYNVGTGKTLAAYIADQLNKLVIRKYESGYCYYRIPIRHFDDDQTPWTLTADMTSGEVATIYGYANGQTPRTLTEASTQNYLGRYGVVRNTCYTVEIEGIKHIGNPEPYTSILADDNPTQFVSLKMSVLPWISHDPQSIE